MFHSLTHHSSHPDIDSDKTQQVGPCLGVYISVCLSCMHLDYSGPGSGDIGMNALHGHLYVL